MRGLNTYEWLRREAACVSIAMLFSASAQAGYQGEKISFPQIIIQSNNQEAPPLDQHGSYSVETNYDDDAHVTHFSLNIGLGPELTPGRLRAFDIRSPSEGKHKLSVVAVMSYRSVDSAFDNYGLFAGYVDTFSSVIGINKVSQKALSTYLNGRVEEVHERKESLYLQQGPSFALHRSLTGARYQLFNSQSLKFELATLDQFGQVAVQWSTVIP